jgi:PIN domain nuclease of toxin-antitoxin system
VADQVSGLLLDTHALLWWMDDAPQLPAVIRSRLMDPAQVVQGSFASIWEIAIKARRGRLQGVEDYLADHDGWHRRWGFQVIAIESSDAVCAGSLPSDHADPFDRMLIAQSSRLASPLVTCDTAITAIHDLIAWG